MKTTILKTIALSVLLLGVFSLNAQDVPPPPPPGHNQTGNQEGGRGPVGEGILLLLGLGATYGVRKFYLKKRSSLIDE